MRGKGSARLSKRTGVGITPAYAGKRSHADLQRARTQDHPRVCGEKHFNRSTIRRVWGSPPRMRGKVDRIRIHFNSPGITPAYAGKRSAEQVGQRVTRDHPRVCGEKAPTKRKRRKLPGSPPRMRGKGRNVRNKSVAFGITPAYAGKSLVKDTSHGGVRDHPRVCGEKHGKRCR